MQTVRMAWRNVWRNTRRSVVTIAAMAFGLWVMILYSGLIEGMLVQMERDVLDLEVGEVQVVADGYRDNPSLYLTISDPDALLKGIEGLGFTAAPRLLGGGLAAAGDNSAGVALVGLDVARDAQVTVISKRLADGEWLDSASPNGVIVGRALARTLGVAPGDELLLLSQGADGGIANDLYQVRGVLGAVGGGVDRGMVLMTEASFRGLMSLPEGAHQITVRVPPGQDLLAAADAVRGLAAGLDVMTWRQLMPTVAMMMDSSRGVIAVVYVIIYLAIAILILNAMLMAVFERIREFGVMKAIGYSPGTVFSLIALESALQTAVATAIGLALAVPAMVYLTKVGINTGAIGGMSVMGMTFHQNWTGLYPPNVVVAPALTLWVMVGGAVLYPALRAARIRPIEAMRYR